MKFCQQCGQTLSILTQSSGKYCEQCTPAPPKPPPLESENTKAPDIFSATFSCIDGKIMLKSKEGWILWSGSASQEHSLQNIVDRAAPILKIRSRRNK